MSFAGRPQGWQALGKLGLAFTFAAAIGCGVGVPTESALARESVSGTVRMEFLPREAQQTQRLIRAGGPFPYAKDGIVFGNRERRLPPQERGYYREYTVPTPSTRDRGARRIVCGGREPTSPVTCYYTDDHYASFRRILP